MTEWFGACDFHSKKVKRCKNVSSEIYKRHIINWMKRKQLRAIWTIIRAQTFVFMNWAIYVGSLCIFTLPNCHEITGNANKPGTFGISAADKYYTADGGLYGGGTRESGLGSCLSAITRRQAALVSIPRQRSSHPQNPLQIPSTSDPPWIELGFHQTFTVVVYVIRTVFFMKFEKLPIMRQAINGRKNLRWPHVVPPIMIIWLLIMAYTLTIVLEKFAYKWQHYRDVFV